MNIIVTGASRGIGYELVKILSADNSNKVIAVSRNADKLNQLKNDCKTHNSFDNVIAIPCDLSDSKAVEGLQVEVNKHFDVLDILINNAGAIVNKPFLEITQEDLSYVYNVNVFSVVGLVQKMLPLMGKKGKSHVVNISSIGGVQGSLKFAGLSAYSSSKAALVCLTECLSEELKESNIVFNCLALGATQTEMLEEAFPGYQAPITPSQMAKFIANFSLNAHEVMNGKIVPVSLSNP